MCFFSVIRLSYYRPCALLSVRRLCTRWRYATNRLDKQAILWRTFLYMFSTHTSIHLGTFGYPLTRAKSFDELKVLDSEILRGRSQFLGPRAFGYLIGRQWFRIIDAIRNELLLLLAFLVVDWRGIRGGRLVAAQQFMRSMLKGSSGHTVKVWSVIDGLEATEGDGWDSRPTIQRFRRTLRGRRSK